jgi:hypothetical protein
MFTRLSWHYKHAHQLLFLKSKHWETFQNVHTSNSPPVEGCPSGGVVVSLPKNRVLRDFYKIFASVFKKRPGFGARPKIVFRFRLQTPY